MAVICCWEVAARAGWKPVIEWHETAVVHLARRLQAHGSPSLKSRSAGAPPAREA